jgi:ABC-type dipeptide/oligopeptide/nickel transport system permease subunit
MRSRFNKIIGLKLDVYSQAALFCLSLILVTGLLSNFIATSKPIYIKHDGKVYFPALSNKKILMGDKWQQNPNNIDWYNLPDPKIFAPVPYDPGKSDYANANYQPPFAKSKCVGNPVVPEVKTCNLPFRHWLGTNLKGEDLLSGLIHGTSVSLKIGFFSILIALIIGCSLGMLAGYFQNDTWKVHFLSFVIICVSIIPSLYLANIFSFFLQIYGELKNTALFLGSFCIYIVCLFTGFLISYFLGKMIHFVFNWKKKISIPFDTIISRIIEIFAAVPKLMLVVALAAILERGVTNVILIIGISSWAGIARLVRAETLKIRNQDFILSAKALGLKHTRIILKHVLPNVSGPIIVSFVFGLSAAILIESGLSFLNMGVPENVVTWGQLLADGKKNFNAWWLIVFPGFAIFLTVLCLNILGEKFKSMLDPKNRSFT